MRNITVRQIGPFADPESIHRTIAGAIKRDRPGWWAKKHGPIAMAAVTTVNRITDYTATPFVFFVWGVLLFSSFFNRIAEAQADTDGVGFVDTLLLSLDNAAFFQATASIVGVFIATLWYRFKGLKVPDDSGYVDYYHHLARVPVAPGTQDEWLRKAITSPNSPEEYAAFISWHEGYLAWLAARGYWRVVRQVLDVTRRRFVLDPRDSAHQVQLINGGYADSDYSARTAARQGTSSGGVADDPVTEEIDGRRLPQYLTDFVADLRAHRTGLSAEEKPVAILRKLLQHWLETREGDIAAQSLALTSLLKPALTKAQRVAWEYYLEKNAVNTQAFKALDIADQVAILRVLLGGNDASKLTALSLLHDNSNFFHKDRQALMSAYIEDYQRDPNLTRAIRWFLDKSDSALCLEGLLSLFSSEAVADKEMGMLHLFRMAAVGEFPLLFEVYLASFMRLYKQLRPSQQASLNQEFSNYRMGDYRQKLQGFRLTDAGIDLAFFRLGAAFLLAAHQHTYPKTQLPCESALMLEHAMPQRVFFWNDAWQEFFQVFSPVNRVADFLEITKNFVVHRFLRAEHDSDASKVAMLLLGATQINQTVFCQNIVQKVIAAGKMSAVLKALMQVVFQKRHLIGEQYNPVEDDSGLRELAKAFFTVLLRQAETLVLSPEDAAYLTHLFDSNSNLMLSVYGIYDCFKSQAEFSWVNINVFQSMLVRQALMHVRTLDVPDASAPASMTPEQVVAATFYFQPMLPDVPLDAHQIKSNRICFVGSQGNFLNVLFQKSVEAASQVTGVSANVFAESGLQRDMLYWRLHDLVFVIRQDAWLSIRGEVLENMLRFLKEISARVATGEVSRSVLDDVSYFVLRALLEEISVERPDVSLAVWVYYFGAIMHAYQSSLADIQTVPELFFALRDVVGRYFDRSGVLKLALACAQRFLLYARGLRVAEAATSASASQTALATRLTAAQAEGIALSIIYQCYSDDWSGFVREAGSDKDLPSVHRSLSVLMMNFDQVQCQSFLASEVVRDPAENALTKVGFRALNSFVQSMAVANRPLQILQALQFFWESQDADLILAPSVSCKNDIALTFDRFGFLQDEHQPFRSFPARFPIINQLLVYLIELAPGQQQVIHAELLLRFVASMRDEDAAHHLSVFTGLVLPEFSVAKVRNFQAYLSKSDRVLFMDVVQARFIALLIFSMHPPVMHRGVFATSPFCYADHVKNILEAFDLPKDLGDARVQKVRTQLENFGMDPRMMAQLKEKTKIYAYTPLLAAGSASKAF